MKYDYRIEQIWDNGEFMTGATLVFLADDERLVQKPFKQDEHLVRR